MNLVEEGGRLRVRRDETFVVERRGLGGSGYRTMVEVPDGIQHLDTTTEGAGGGFGAKPRIREWFRCCGSGTFSIRFVSGRPWQEATSTVVTTVECD